MFIMSLNWLWNGTQTFPVRGRASDVRGEARLTAIRVCGRGLSAILATLWCIRASRNGVAASHRADEWDVIKTSFVATARDAKVFFAIVHALEIIRERNVDKHLCMSNSLHQKRAPVSSHAS